MSRDLSIFELGQMFCSAIDAADYLCRKMDQYERDQRYDDNQKKLLEQALRLYESGKIDKKGLISIIKVLPEQETKKEAQPEPNELIKLLKELS